MSARLGAQVTIVVVSATDWEFHVHGYDLLAGGTRVTFSFTADIPGTFAIARHDAAHTPIGTLVVS